MPTATRQGRRLLAGGALLLVLAVIATTESTVRRTRHTPAVAAEVITTRAVHDVSDSLRGIAPMPAATAVPSAAERTEAVMEANEAQARAASEPGVPDEGAAEQTAFGPRPPITPAITFDNGLNGGSTSDNNIARGPGLDRRDAQLAVQGDVQDRRDPPRPGQQQQHLRGHQRGAGRSR